LTPFENVGEILLNELGDANVSKRRLVARCLMNISDRIDYCRLAELWLKEDDAEVAGQVESIFKLLDDENSLIVVTYLLEKFGGVDRNYFLMKRIATLVSSLAASVNDSKLAVSFIKRLTLLAVPTVLVEAVRGLSAVQSEEMKALLLDLSSSDSELIRAAALLELSFTDYDVPQDKLTALLTSQSLEVVKYGALALAKRGTCETLSALVEAHRKFMSQVLATDSDLEVRSILQNAIEIVRGREEQL
jgi:HEAT repeat protein